MSKEPMRCEICNKHEKDQNKILTCMYCFSEAHYKCRNILGSAVLRIKEKMFFCTPHCSNIYQRIIEIQNTKSSIVVPLIAEVKNSISSAVNIEMHGVRSEMKQLKDAIEASQEFLSNRFESIVNEFNAMKVENKILKQQIDELKGSLSALEGSVNKLEMDVDRKNKRDNDDTAVLLGLPYSSGENVQNIVAKVMNHIGVKNSTNLIHSVTRIYETRKETHPLIPIRITFRNSESKGLVCKKKKDYGKLLSSTIDPHFIRNGQPTTVILRDQLTPLSLDLLRQVRECQKSMDIKYVWSGKGGTVWIRKDDSAKPSAIRSRHDLMNIKDTLRTATFAKTSI